MRSPGLWSSVGVLVLAAAVLASVFGGVLAEARPFLVLVFFVCAPGLAWLWVLPVRHTSARLALTIGFSLIVDTAVAMALMYTRQWSIPSGTLTLVAITLLGLAVHGVYLLRRRRPRRGRIGVPERDLRPAGSKTA